MHNIEALTATILESTMGKRIYGTLFAKPTLSEEDFSTIVSIYYSDLIYKYRDFANLNFETNTDPNYTEFYSEFAVQVILKRLRVCYPELSITIPAVLLLLFFSESVGNLASYLDAFATYTLNSNETVVSTLSSLCWDTFPERSTE